jgi:uncharacterized protein YuzE
MEIFFDYDQENDSLFAYKKAKIKGSIDIGYFIIDISTQGKVVGIEILDISKVLKNLGIFNTKKFLDNIKKAGFRAVYQNDSIMIYFMISSKSKEVSSSIAIPVKYN